MDWLPSQSLWCSAAEQWGLGVSCRRVVLGWRTKPPLAQGCVWEKWPVKSLSWFLDPSSAPRRLNLSFPEECPNLHTKSRIKISLISLLLQPVTEQAKRRIHETYSSSSALWEAVQCGKQEILNPDVSKLHLKFINSLEHELGPRLSLPPHRLSQGVPQSDSCILSLHLSQDRCAPAHPSNSPAPGTWHRDLISEWLCSELALGMWKQPKALEPAF